MAGMAKKQQPIAKSTRSGATKAPYRTLYLVKQVQYKTFLRLEAALQPLGVTTTQFRILTALSRGDKRRLELAMCLVQQPRLLLLDEPTAGMSRADTNNTIELLKRIAGRGLTMVIIEHDMHVVFSLADRISVLAQGTVIAEGEPAQIKGDPRVREAYLGGAQL